MAAKKKVPAKKKAAKKKAAKKQARGGGKKRFLVRGGVSLETLDSVPRELALTAYAFGEDGAPLGEAPVSEKGAFELDLPLDRPAGIEIVVSPRSERVREVKAYSRKYAANDWESAADRFELKPAIHVWDHLVSLWWPRRICVSGHIRKVVHDENGTHYCPVPFTKVEVFDVDRESCWWPYIVKLKDLLRDRRVVRADELLKNAELAAGVREALKEARRVPPVPDPGPIGVSPLPDPPALPADLVSPAVTGGRAVGEVAALEATEARAFENLSITARAEPWVLFPWCYYSRAKVCQGFTDCSGYFSCCFWWPPFHLRRGRLRLDLLPDIVIRATQVIDGVEKVIYLDPYTSTRWNSGNTHIDLFLDDDDIVCGPGCGPHTDLGDCDASVLQLGADPVWKIDRANGLYTAGGESNGAYGSTLLVRGDFAPAFKDGSPKRYYQLSWAEATSGGGVPADSAFHPVQTTLEAWRAAPGGTFSSYVLGPKPVGGTAGLYEVQDTAHWWIPKNFPLSTPGGMVLGLWPTGSESDEGTYWLRLEVYDQNGNKLSSAKFCNYEGDGSGVPIPPTASIGKLDLKVHVDNAALAFDLETPATNACGVIPWTPSLQLDDFKAKLSQPNGRVRNWTLVYNKGVDPTTHAVTPGPSSGYFSSGTAVVDQTVNAHDLLTGLSSTCAFAFQLRAWGHVRVNYGWRYHGMKPYAIAIEKCPPCP